MGQAPGIVTDILKKVDHCELCSRPADDENPCDVFVIDKIDPDLRIDLSKNIIVLCPGCKKRYDDGVFGKRHLKACVRLRNNELSSCLSDLFELHDIGCKSPADKKRLMGRVQHWLVNDQKHIDNVVLLSGVFFLLVGILLFCYSFNLTSNYDGGTGLNNAVDAGQDSSGYLFNLFLELAGVTLAFIGLFFELQMVKTPGKMAVR